MKMFGQQDPQYTQYMYNLALINPGYSGFNTDLKFGLLSRYQWVGVSGAPKTFTGFVNGPIGNKIGVGLSILHDDIGPITETSVYTDISYTVNLSEESKLAFGLKSGGVFQEIDLLRLNQVNSNDSQFNRNLDRVYPNFGLGFFYYLDRLYLGVSIPNLLESNHFENSGETITKASEKAHVFLTIGYVFNLKNDFVLKPSLLSKYTKSTPLSVDASLNLQWNKVLELGISHRFNDSWSAVVNLRVKKNLRIGYGYDYLISNLSSFSGGSHEILLLFDINLKPKEKGKYYFF